MKQAPVLSNRFPFLTVGFLQSRLLWSIHVRWFIAAGILLATLVTKYILLLDIPLRQIWYIAFTLIILNTIYYAILRIFKEFHLRTELVFLHLHIIIDLLILTVLIHFAGGIDNPVFLFYLFHVVLSSIVFSRMAATIYATFVVFLFSLLIFLEYNDLITHYTIYDQTLYKNQMFIKLLLVVFVITVYVTSYICTTFMMLYREIKRKIDRLNDQLIAADQEKTNFFRFTSHELKSPIIAIKSTIDGVLKKYGGSLDERASQMLQRASLRSGQMLDIIRELLELSRGRSVIKNDRENIEAIDLELLLGGIVANETVNAEQRKIKIRQHIGKHLPNFHGNPEDIEKIFRNLLNNAIRYTGDGGKVELVAAFEDQHFVFSVSDTGIGIPKDEQDKIFNEFYRSENAKKIVNFGTGLGLSLVKHLVEKYNGEIAVESEVGKGTTFRVRIPAEGRAS